MNAKTDVSTNKLDTIKWTFAILTIVVGTVSFYYFEEYPPFIRVVGLLFLVGIALFTVSRTGKGRSTVEFLREARTEVRKVVWPTRQETVQMTGIVIVMVVLVALIIWLLDSILFWIVRWLTG